MRAPGQLRGAIVAMTRDRVIGVDGRLPWHYREDMRRFKRRTMGCAVIMGRVTWDSLGRKALPGRRNIVLSRRAVAGVEHYDDIGRAVAACEGGDFWVIGGAEV
ncbi:MAG: dihydrofolate reductase, partial [Gammaproteobacteria bacterium]